MTPIALAKALAKKLTSEEWLTLQGYIVGNPSLLSQAMALTNPPGKISK